MVRAGTRRGTRRPELRDGLIIKAKSLADAFPSAGMAEHLASLRGCDPVILDSVSMFTAHFNGIGPSAADPFVYRSDPDNVRRWLLDEHDVLTELDPVECTKRECRCLH